METRQRVGCTPPCHGCCGRRDRRGQHVNFMPAPIDDAAGIGGGRNERARMCHPPPHHRQGSQGTTTEYVVAPCPSIPLPLTKTLRDDDEQVVVVVVPLLLLSLPSRPSPFLPPHTSCCLLLVPSAMMWHRELLSLADSDVAVGMWAVTWLIWVVAWRSCAVDLGGDVTLMGDAWDGGDAAGLLVMWRGCWGQ
jgi:hypothetical protein